MVRYGLTGSTDHSFHGPAKHPRQAAVSLPQQAACVTRVSTENFVPAIPCQNNLDVTSSHGRNQRAGNDGGITEGLRRQCVGTSSQVYSLLRQQRFRVMQASEPSGHAGRMRTLIVGRLIESRCKRTQPVARHRGGQCAYSAGIDAAGKKGPNLHIGSQLSFCYGIHENFADIARGIATRPMPPRSIWLPVTHLSSVTIRLNLHPVRWEHFPYTDDASMAWHHIAIPKVIGNGCRIFKPRHIRQQHP